jgi:hypothetical protein
MKVQIVTPFRVSHLQRCGVTVRGNVRSVYPPLEDGWVTCYTLQTQEGQVIGSTVHSLVARTALHSWIREQPRTTVPCYVTLSIVHNEFHRSAGLCATPRDTKQNYGGVVFARVGSKQECGS